MKMLVLAAMVAGSLACAGQAEAAGCLKGAAVGGVAGHFAGHHAILGAVAGCAIGRHRASQQRKMQQQQMQPTPTDGQPPQTQM